MKTLKHYSSFVLFFFLLPCGNSYGQAENISFFLKDGTTIQGKIVAQDDVTCLVETQYGTLEIKKVNILKQEPVKERPAKTVSDIIQTIHLKDGSVVKGTVISEDQDSLKIKTSYGMMTILQSNIKPPTSRILPRKTTEVQTEPVKTTAGINVLQDNLLSDSYPSGKGSRIIGGLASFSVTKISDVEETLTDLTIAPNYIYFVDNGIGLGFDMSLGWQSYGKTSSTTIALGPKFILAFGKPAGTSFPYIGFGFDYLSISQTYEEIDYYYDYSSSSTATKTTSGNIIKIGVGMMTMIGHDLGLPVEFGIIIFNIESEKMTIYSIGVGLAGFLY